MSNYAGISQSWLDDLGYGALSGAQARSVLRRAYEALQLSVGEELSEGLNNRQLMEFDHMVSFGDDEGAEDFLRRNVPNYREVVIRQTESLADALRNAASRYKQEQETQQSLPDSSNVVNNQGL